MLKHRCPWCGEWLPMEHKFVRNFILLLYRKEEPLTCPKCHKSYHEYRAKEGLTFKRISLTVILILVLIVVFDIIKRSMILVLSDVNPIILLLVVIPCIFAASCLGNGPYERHYSKTEKLNISKKVVLGTIHWKGHGSNGLFMPRLQVKEGEIFPAYFKDQAGNLISSGLCVVLEEIKWTGKRQCNCEISFVLDDAPSERYLQPNNQFYLYYYDRQIAEGAIL